MNQVHRWSTLAAAAVALAACAKKDANVPDSAAGSVAPASATATPAVNSDSAAKAAAPAMTDANIVAEEHGGDSSEVAVAKYAETHASNPEVKAYARLLVADHSKGDKEVTALAKKLSITPQPAAGDTTSTATANTLTRLGTLKGFDFDTAFVNHEIADHNADIAAAHSASAAAQAPEVKALVDKSLPELQKHLDRAQALSTKLTAAKK